MAKKSKKSIIEQLSEVKYVGPSKAESFVEELDIESIEDLIEAARAGDLEKVKGVGASTQAKILEAAETALEDLEEQTDDVADQAMKAAEKAEEAAEETVEKAAKTAKETVEAAAEAVEEATSTAKEAAKSAKKKSTEKKSTEKKSKKKKAAKKSAKSNGAAEKAESKPAAAKSDDAQTPIEQFIDALRCPACGHDDFKQGPTSLTCTACRREYSFQNGIADLAPPKPSGRGVTQHLMESRFYARFYEDVMRPRLTSLVSGRTMREEYALSTEMLDLDADTRLLDVACGTGNFTRYFTQKLREQHGVDGDFLVTGMDLSWPMLETARTYLRREGLDEQVYLVRGDASRVPARRAAFNRLHCSGALHLMPRVDEVLRNFARVVEPGGICVIGTFRIGDSNPVKRLLKRAAELPTQFHWFTEDELGKRLERAGFDLVEADAADDALTVKAVRQ
ncbi:MAG: methyltransferase domain-containing protein [Myxococcota bacterium]